MIMDKWIEREFDLYEKTYNIKLNRNNILKVIENVPEDYEYSLYLKNKDYTKLNLTEKELTLIIPLMNKIPITPLTGDDSEWMMVINCSNDSFKFYGNKRSINTYKKEFENGITIFYHKFYIENALDACGTTNIENREIEFPFTVPDNYTQYIYKYNHEFNGLLESILLTNNETIKKVKDLMKSKIICSN